MTDVATRLAAALADRYLIERELGQGGMATVFLAEDIRHRRKVAVKVVHPELAAILGADRFLAEIHVTATLQHPHILPLFDSGQADGQLFYVMPFVEGESLRSRLHRERQLPIEDAIKLTTEVAGALDYAHRHGVIHRDIKPENILVHDGQAMVADFGIALAVTNAGGGRLTQTGLSLGTPQYMSPEQATGERDIDARSDVYSLGAVTYEMLTGEAPFTGPTAQAIVAKVITSDPPALTARRRSIPPHIEDAVLKALEKMPADRFATAAEFSRALSGAAVASVRPTSGGSRAKRGAITRWKTIALASGGLAAVLAGVVVYLATRPQPEEPVSRFEVTFEGAANRSVGSDAPGISPDGSKFVFPDDEGTLLIRDRAELKAAPLSGAENGWSPFFSPDGGTIAFATGFPGALKSIPVSGGTARIIVADSVYAEGGSWGDDGWIYFVGTSDGIKSLLKVRPDGTNISVVAKPDSAQNELFFYWPDALPGGRAVLLTVWHRRGEPNVGVIDTKTGKLTLLGSGVRGVYAGDGILVIVQPDGTAMASRFDTRKLATRGRPVPVITGIRASGTGRTVMQLSRSGSLLYETRVASSQIVRVDRFGAVVPLDAEWVGSFQHLSLSPDGTRLAIGVENNARTEVWVRDLASGTMSRLAAEGTYSYRPSWSPDGKRVLFTSDHSGTPALFSVAADGSSPPTVVKEGRRGIDEGELSRDGRWLVHRIGSGSGRDINVSAVSGDTASRPLLSTPAEEFSPALSPDGRWLAYGSDETKRSEVYVRPFPDVSAARWKISRAGGFEPLWSADGRELYYRSLQGNLVAVSIDAGSSFRVSSERTLFSTREYISDSRHRGFAVSPDGRYFYFIHTLPGKESKFIVVTNWLSELKGKLAAAK